MLKDVQNLADDRNIDIARVGVKKLRYPTTVFDKDMGEQQTIAEFNMYVDLPRHYKGTHMSRFVEILNKHGRRVSLRHLSEILEAMKHKLNAKSAQLELTFPYFIEKSAPVTGTKSLMEYKINMTGSLGDSLDLMLGLHIPVNTLCPCSKEISEFGAHNQRGEVCLKVRFKKFVWIEDLVKLAESAASSGVYSLLKREDEKFVTEHAYKTPRFVEDVVREIAIVLTNDPNIIWFSAECENFESIHNHSAYACVEYDKYNKQQDHSSSKEDA